MAMNLCSRNWKEVNETRIDKGWKGGGKQLKIIGHENFFGFYFEFAGKTLEVLSRGHHMILFARDNFAEWRNQDRVVKESRKWERNLEAVTVINLKWS